MKHLLVVLLFFNMQTAKSQSLPDTVDLKLQVESFIKAADSSDVTSISKIYDPAFENVRVTDHGDIIKLSRQQILNIFSTVGKHQLPTKSTVIQHVEVIENMGFVLLTRVKNLGNGWEPMFYSLVWRMKDNKWLLLREFVHQKTLPSPAIFLPQK